MTAPTKLHEQKATIVTQIIELPVTTGRHGIHCSQIIHLCLILLNNSNMFNFSEIKKRLVESNLFFFHQVVPHSVLFVCFGGGFCFFYFFHFFPKDKIQTNLKLKSFFMLESNPLEVSLVFWGVLVCCFFFFAGAYYYSSEGVTVQSVSCIKEME